MPAGLFGAAAWWNREEVLRDGADAVERTTAVMHEHVAKVFDIAALILGRVEDRIQGLDPAAVAAPQMNDFLRRMKDSFDPIVSIWVSGPDGHVLAGSQAWDRSVTIADREFFRAHADGRASGTHVSAAFSGRATAITSFAISRRRSGPDGAFAGVIHVSFSPDYFARFFAGAAPLIRHTATLFRADGAVLARDPVPATPLGPLSDRSPVLARIATRPEGGTGTDRSSIDGTVRVYAYRQVAPWPVYVAFGSDRHGLLARWRDNLIAYGIMAGVAALTLLAVAWLALRQAHAAEAAGAALRREAAARAAAEARFRGVFESRAIGISLFDAETARTLLMNDRLLEMTGRSRAGLEAGAWDWPDITLPEQMPRDEAAIAQARARGWFDPFEKDFLRPDGSRLPVRLSSAPMPGEPGHVVIMVQDISEQRAAELRRDLLMREVDHRAKNALATARAALRLTRAPSLEDFVREVDGRIGALAGALQLLSTTSWAGADLAGLLRGELAPFLGTTRRPGEPVADLSGPPVTLAATAVQPLAMAVHELATNATKYGALSAPGGRLALRWRLEAGELRLLWEEQGGPPVTAQPGTAGFGTRVLRATVKQQLGGRLEMTWDPAGLRCEIALPAGRSVVGEGG
ncbi:PAS domain S-box protein [Belnapia sp. T6]|uniref:histidine kinase n=1 Tax=Belnapia mucosa TaxID=2804532 RepID=A0ABS1UZI0_9PROT|nr:PAS domain S-box protein [Belnapia mucosa]